MAALVSLTEKFSQTVADNSDLQESINHVMYTEVSRKSMKYVKKILPLYARYINVNPQEETITFLIEKAKEMIRLLGSESDDSEGFIKQTSDESTIKELSLTLKLHKSHPKRTLRTKSM